MADGSTRVVYVALAGNTLVAVTKFIAAVISGSSSMLTEAIHSTTDTANQLLLIVGDRRSRARADAGHDFGYGMEIYYWTFAVAIMILVAGGVLSLYTGWVRFHSPKPIARVPLSLIVLGLCAIFEGVSFMFAYREYRRVAGRHVIPGFPVGLGTFIRLSKDPNLFEPLLEDGAALVGLAIAAAGVIVTHLGIVWADGAASMAIGALLIVVAFAILIATKGLMGGEAVAQRHRQGNRGMLRQYPSARGEDLASRTANHPDCALDYRGQWPFLGDREERITQPACSAQARRPTHPLRAC